MPTRSFDSYLSRVESEPAEREALDAARARLVLGQKVLGLREAAGLSQRALATASGVRQADISRIEAGKANPTVDTLGRLGAELGVEIAFVQIVEGG